MWKDFVQGFIKGAKETPRGFFAPTVAIWRLLLDTTESLVKPKKAKQFYGCAYRPESFPGHVQLCGTARRIGCLAITSMVTSCRR